MDFPEITRCWIWDFLIAMKIRCVHVPMCKNRVYIQPLLIFTMTPFANFVFTPHFPIPNFGKLLTALSCHFPFWHMSHMRRAGHPSDRWSTGLQLHQWCYRHGHVERTSILFTAVESQLGERQVWLSSFMAVFVRTIWSLVIPRYEVLTAERGKLNQSQCWKRGASLLKEKCEDKEGFFNWISTFCKNNKNGCFNGEAPRARSSIRENLVVTWPSVRPSAQQENQY